MAKNPEPKIKVKQHIEVPVQQSSATYKLGQVK